MKNIKFPEAIQKNVAIISITYNNVIELTTNGLCQLPREWAGGLNSWGCWHQLHALAREPRSLDFLH